MREILVDDENMVLEVEFVEGFPTLHLQVKRWSHTLLRNYYYPQWARILQLLKEQGHDVVLAVIPSTEIKIAKFHALMGMHEAFNDGNIIISRRWL